MTISVRQTRVLILTLMRKGDIAAIQQKVDQCLSLAMNAIGGVDTVLGQELHRLIADFSATRTMQQFDSPLNARKDYLKGVPIKNLHASKPGIEIIQ